MGVPVREAPHSRSKETEAHVKHSLGARRLKRHAMMVSLLEAIVREETEAMDAEIEALGGPDCLRAWVARRNLAPMPRINAFLKWLIGSENVTERDKDALRRYLRGARRDF